MDTQTNLFWDPSAAKERLEDLRQAQGEFATKLFSAGAEFQRKQFSLLSDIVQNQVAFNSSVLANALNIINDNRFFADKKAAKTK